MILSAEEQSDQGLHCLQLGEKVNRISGTKNYLIVRKDKLGLKLKINVSTFNFWVSCVPESVASY